jgi:hypothetical protein
LPALSVAENSKMSTVSASTAGAVNLAAVAAAASATRGPAV